MSLLLGFYRNIINLLLSLFVRNRSIPNDPAVELNLNLDIPILYLLPYTSQSDLLILQRNCEQLKLPNPLHHNEFDEKLLPRFVFLDKGRGVFKSKKIEQKARNLFGEYFALLNDDQVADVQLIPVSVLWGRAPGYEEKPSKLEFLGRIKKLWAILWYGKDNFVRFSPPVSLRQMATLSKQSLDDDKLVHKLMRIGRMHFARQRLSATGPRLPNRVAMFNKILASDVVQEVIQDEASTKKISVDKAKDNAEKILKEIAADMNYGSLRIADRFLGWLWNKLYKGIEVQHADRVRKLAIDGHEIVYIPCHRSHIDYLLLSYVLYHQGLFPPHIAAGINLNFWPAGGRFRRWGAFFIRRTFSGNRLYSTIFRQYLAELFHRGYSVEFFIEGGRSRTGRLLTPKTGMLSMTLQALLQGQNRPISIVPVYIGYEHVLEVDTYAKELRGAAKEKESAGLVLRVIKKLRNMGKGYVSFGEPITLHTYLNQVYPQWREQSATIEQQKQWLPSAVDQLAEEVMKHINNAAAINAMNLIGSILLSSRQRALSKDKLLSQVDFYQQLFLHTAYSKDFILPNESAEDMLTHVLSLDKVGMIVEPDNFGDIIRLDRTSAVLMTYYRNNIQHVFALPSLLALILFRYETVQESLLLHSVKQIFPFLKAELFIDIEESDLAELSNKILKEFECQELISVQDGVIYTKRTNIRKLQLLASHVLEILQRYYITLYFLKISPAIARNKLEKESQSVAHRLAILNGINAPEFFDKAVFAVFIATLKKRDFYLDSTQIDIGKIIELSTVVRALLSSEVNLTIESAVESYFEQQAEQSDTDVSLSVDE